MLALQAYLSHIKAIPIAHAHAVGISRMETESTLERLLEYHCPPAQCSSGVAVIFLVVRLLVLIIRRTVLVIRTRCNVDQENRVESRRK